MRALIWIFIASFSYAGSFDLLHDYRLWALHMPWSTIDTIGCAICSGLLTALILVLVGILSLSDTKRALSDKER